MKGKGIAALLFLYFAPALVLAASASLPEHYRDRRINESWFQRSTAMFDLAFPSEWSPHGSAFMAALSDSYRHCSDLFRLRTATVIRAIIDPGTPPVTALPRSGSGDSLMMSVFPDDRALQRTFRYEMAQVLLRDRLTPSGAATFRASWVRAVINGAARYASLGYDHECHALISHSMSGGSWGGLKEIRENSSPLVAERTVQALIHYIRSTGGDASVGRFFATLAGAGDLYRAIALFSGRSFDAYNQGFVSFCKNMAEAHGRRTGEALQLQPAVENGIAAAIPLFVCSRSSRFIYLERGISMSRVMQVHPGPGSERGPVVLASFPVENAAAPAAESNRCAAVSSDGNVLAYVMKTSEGNSLVMVDVRTGRRLHRKVLPFRAVYDLALSGDASVLVFSAFASLTSDLYRYLPRTGELTRLTHDSAVERFPAFMPGETLVCYSRSSGREAGASTWAIYRVSLAGGENLPLYSGTGTLVHSAVAPDGETIIFVTLDRGAPGLVAWNAATGSPAPWQPAITGALFPIIDHCNRVTYCSWDGTGLWRQPLDGSLKGDPLTQRK